MPFVIKDPTLHGTNVIQLNNSICNTVTVGNDVREWKDDSEDASLNTTVSRSSEQAYIGDYSAKLVCLNTLTCKAVYRAYGFGTAGEEFELSCKVFVPTGATAEPLVLQLMVGTTLGASDLGISGAMECGKQPRGEWLQAPTCSFLATGGSLFLTWSMYANQVNDYIYVDNILVRPKKLDWSNDT